MNAPIQTQWQFSAIDDEILSGIVSLLWAHAWADHCDHTGCTSLSGVQIENVMPPIPQAATDLGYALASEVIKRHGCSLEALYRRALQADVDDPENRECAGRLHPGATWLDSPTRFGECIAYEAMGAGVSWEDDHATRALNERCHVETWELQCVAQDECGCMRFDVHVRSSDEYADEEGRTYSEWAPGRQNTVYLDVHTPDYQRAKAWAEEHQGADGGTWETARDLGGLVYDITYDRPELIADLEAEGYTLDLSEYDETPVGLILTAYEIVTPESAEHGDAPEQGFIDEEGTPYTLSEAIAMLEGCEPSSSHWHKGLWYTQADGSTDYRTGAETRESYHMRGFGPEYERRVYEAVTGRKVPR